MTIKINTYTARLTRDRIAGGSGSAISYYFATIVCRGEGWNVILRFFTPESPLLDNEVQSSLKRIYVNIPSERFPYYMDLLRNEKPISFSIFPDQPNVASLYTGAEPVGEEEDQEEYRRKITIKRS